VEASEPLTRPKSGSMADIGFLLVGHGTRNVSGQDQFKELYAKFASNLSPAKSALAFLELADPDIPTAIRELARQGVKQFISVPLLLFTAGHALKDIPEAVAVASKSEGIECLGQTPSLGTAQPILELSAIRFRQAACPAHSIRCLSNNKCEGKICEQTALVMIGRGSKSETATAEMRRFSELRHALTPTGYLSTGFIYAQSPTVEEALDMAAETEFPNVVVQPHLLFEGELLNNLRDSVALRNQTASHKTWTIAPSLGLDESLPKALAELALGASFGTIESLDGSKG